MNELLKIVGDVYMPEKALLIYRSKAEGKYYVESFDMDENGCPINAHPLSLKESNALALALDSSAELKQNFLMSRGLLPENVLFINSNRNGFAVWYTPPMKANLCFKEDLTIPDGIAAVPSLLWKASKNKLHVWALAEDVKPHLDSQIYHAPFFNVYSAGAVCMGNVEVQILPENCLEDFIAKWQSYFFGSKFSHLIVDNAPTEQNIVQLWQSLIGTGKKFPVKKLKKSNQTFKSILK
jgi:PRTRC genetic system protein B